MEERRPHAGPYQLDDLVLIMNRLLAPDGCPWDRQQTHESLKPYVIEEAYEVVAAIDEEDPRRLTEELGDLLLQVVFHAALGERAGTFRLADVIQAICEKLIRRHPHVFGDRTATDGDGVSTAVPDWEAIKKEERKASGHEDLSLLDAVTPGLPAMMHAQKLQARASRVGFDWGNAADAWAKVEEELAEFQDAWRQQDHRAMEDEWGDVIFSLINVARLLRFDAESTLLAANHRFAERFRAMEQLAAQNGLDFESLDLQELERLWRMAKERLSK